MGRASQSIKFDNEPKEEQVRGRAGLAQELEEGLVRDALAVLAPEGHQGEDIVIAHVRADVGEQRAKLLLGDDAVLVGIGDLDNILLHAAEERIAVVLRVVLLKDVLEGLGMGESSMLGLVRAGVRCATRIAQQ